MMYLATIPRYEKDKDVDPDAPTGQPIDVSDLFNSMNNGNT